MVMFDAPEPSRAQGSAVQRRTGQSLLLLNNPFVHQQAQAWAVRDLHAFQNLSLEQRVERLFYEALARKPSASGISDAGRFCPGSGGCLSNCLTVLRELPDPRLWSDVCHVLLNAKEFLYLP